MKLNDIHTDLESEVNAFPDYKKKELKISELWENNTSDIFSVEENNQNNINLSQWKHIKIFKKKNNFLSRKISLDSIKSVKKSKSINISKNYKNKITGFKNTYKNISSQVSDKNLWNKLSDNILNIKNNFINIKNNFSEDIKTSKNDLFLNIEEFFNNNFKKNKNEFKNKKIRIKKEKSFLFKFSFTLLILFTCLVSLKFSIQASVNNGYDKLISIKNWSWEFKTVQSIINDAKFSFILSDILFTPFSIIPNESIDNWYHVIKWWKKITALWDEMLQFVDWLQKLINEKWINNIYSSQVLENNKNIFLIFEDLLSQSLLHYDKIKNIWNSQLEITFNNTLIKLHKLLSYIKTINLNFDEFLALLWHWEIRDYLIVFQNNDEIRPTGWFMWSMWIVSVYKWKVVDIKKTDVYAYEWEINKTYEQNNLTKELAPEWLDQITGTWGLRDSNYQPMIKDTAADIKWFLDKIDVNIDGIIFINKSTFEDILNVSGWIEFEKLWETITEENFSSIISTLVEAKVSKIWTLGTPKQILFDFAESFYSHMKENNDYLPYAKVIFNDLISRDIIIYSFHSEENSLLWKLNINWELAFHKTLDFAYPVFTSLSWNKSDRYIKTIFNNTTQEIWKCEYKTNLEIIRKHTYNNLEEEKIDVLLNKYNITDKDHIRYIQWKWDNYQYMRVLLPKNVIITEQEWVSVTNYDRYKIAEFYIKTRLYETTSNKIEYTISKENCNWYSYTLYKQPGIVDYDMNLINNWVEINAKEINKDFIISQ